METERRRRWEYRTLQPPRENTQKEARDPTDEMNALGTDGWEFAGTVEYTGGGTKLLVFKRPLGAERDADG
jgi:hypothetical protein